jgi:hypothetical protein
MGRKGLEKSLKLDMWSKGVYATRACNPGHLFSQLPGWGRHRDRARRLTRRTRLQKWEKLEKDQNG